MYYLVDICFVFLHWISTTALNSPHFTLFLLPLKREANPRPYPMHLSSQVLC